MGCTLNGQLLNSHVLLSLSPQDRPVFESILYSLEECESTPVLHCLAIPQIKTVLHNICMYVAASYGGHFCSVVCTCVKVECCFQLSIIDFSPKIMLGV